jgi:hypothetical protein
VVSMMLTTKISSREVRRARERVGRRGRSPTRRARTRRARRVGRRERVALGVHPARVDAVVGLVAPEAPWSDSDCRKSRRGRSPARSPLTTARRAGDLFRRRRPPARRVFSVREGVRARGRRPDARVDDARGEPRARERATPRARARWCAARDETFRRADVSGFDNILRSVGQSVSLLQSRSRAALPKAGATDSRAHQSSTARSDRRSTRARSRRARTSRATAAA